MAKTIATTKIITLRQVRRLADRIVANFPKAGKNLPKAAVQSVLDHEMESMLAEMFEVLRRRVEAKTVLVPHGTINVTLSGPLDPDTFFKTRGGLWVSDSFRSSIVANAKPTNVGTTASLVGSLLAKNLSDGEIEAALPKDHLFDESAVCAIIATMISKQWGGKEGRLLNNGDVTLFYTSSLVVDVFWYAGCRLWGVDAWRRDDHEWYAGLRVFSPATAA